MKDIFFRVLFLSWAFCLQTSCQPLERVSPFTEQTTTKQFAINLGIYNLPLAPQNFSIGVLSDSHQDYDDLQKAVSEINVANPHFVVHTGDFTNQGYNFEFDFFVDRMQKLKMPYVVTTGNHDALTNGQEIYQRIFGPFNMVFRPYGYKFVVFNNNTLDFHSSGGVDFAWLRTAVQMDNLPTVVMMHVTPESNDYFNADQQTELMSIFNLPQVKLVLHGHDHVFYTRNLGSKVIHMTARTKDVQWSRINFTPNSFEIFNCRRSECSSETTLSF